MSVNQKPGAGKLGMWDALHFVMTMTNLNLQLETNEANALHAAIQSYLSETRLELMRTDDQNFRQQLHREIALLSRVEAKLNQMLGPGLDQAA